MNGKHARLLLHYCISNFRYAGNFPSRFLAGCDYNEEDINHHLAKKEKEGYWQVQMNVNKFATSKILKKTSRSCEGAVFSCLSSKVSRTLACSPTPTSGSERANSVHCCPPPVGVGSPLVEESDLEFAYPSQKPFISRFSL